MAETSAATSCIRYVLEINNAQAHLLINHRFYSESLLCDACNPFVTRFAFECLRDKFTRLLRRKDGSAQCFVYLMDDRINYTAEHSVDIVLDVYMIFYT